MRTNMFSCNRTWQSGIMAAAVLAWSVVVHAASEDVDQNIEKKSPAELVALLSDEDFELREAASTALVKLGTVAKAAVEGGVGDSDPEVRFRCRRILNSIAYNERFGRLEAFAADVDGKKGLSLPGWDRYTKLIGDDKTSRRLFVDMQRAESALIEAAEKNPKSAADTMVKRCQQLQQSMRYPQFGAGMHSVAAVLFLISDERVPMNDQIGMQLYNLCNQSAFRTAAENGVEKTQLRTLLGAYIKRGGGRNTAYYRLMLAMRYDLKEGLDVAEEMLTTAGMSHHYKQYAMLTIAKLDAKQHMGLLEKLLEDKSQCTAHTTVRNGKRTVYQTQVRDVALASIIHLSGEDPKKFGFDRLVRANPYLFSPGTMGFENDEQRKKTFEKWKEHAAKNKQDAEKADGA
jgi:hypothetical protein